MKYNKKQDKHGTYYIDQNNNKAYLNHFKTKEKCIEALDSLVSCKNCINCIDCNNCVYCNNCAYCTYCTDCNNCNDCDFCTNCTDCNNCKVCYGCNNCTYIDNENNKSNIKITKEQRETYNNNLKDSNKLINDMLGDI